jgi:lipopolysaccharide exporter
MGLLRGSTRAIGFIKIAILARLLTPVQFGIYGVAALVLAFLEVLTETGINVFLVQEEGDIEDYLNTAWLVSIVRGTLISLLIILFTPLIILFFNSPEAKDILYLISIVPFLRGFINPAIIKFQKNLEFNKVFLFQFSMLSIDGLVAVIVAILTKSPVSLVWGLTAGVIVEILASFIFIKPTPKFKFKSTKIKKVVNRGKWMTLAGIFNYVFHQGDDIIVGKLMNIQNLGVYQIAYKISTLPIYESSEVFSKVTFPIYTKIFNDKLRLRKAFFRILIVISLFVIPFGAALFFFPHIIVSIVLGQKWMAAVGVVKVLAVFGVIRSISATTSPLFLAAKKQEYVTLVTLLSITGLGLTIIPFVLQWGVVGAAYSAIIGSLFSLPAMIYYAYKILR